MKTSELIGPALDWAALKSSGMSQSSLDFLLQDYLDDPGRPYLHHNNAPSVFWNQGGPIIEREGIDVQQVFCGTEGSFAEPCGWQAVRHTRGGPINPPRQIASTPLVAAMRCFCASKLGDEIEIPEELT